MRPSIRRIGLLVACLMAGAAVAAAAPAATESTKPGKSAKRSPIQQEAGAFMATVTGLIWPVSTSTSQVDWVAATDVTPEHVAERSGANKASAALMGSTTIIDRTKALLKNEKQLDDLTVRQLRKLLLAAAESPGT